MKKLVLKSGLDLGKMLQSSENFTLTRDDIEDGTLLVGYSNGNTIDMSRVLDAGFLHSVTRDDNGEVRYRVLSILDGSEHNLYEVYRPTAATLPKVFVKDEYGEPFCVTRVRACNGKHIFTYQGMCHSIDQVFTETETLKED